MKRTWLAGLAIGAAAAVIALAGQRTGWMDRIENVTWDWRVRAFAKPGPETSRIKVILLDQASLDWAFQAMALPWPWPREIYGAMLAFLKEGGARAVALDVLFTEPSYMGVHDDEQLAAAIGEGPPFALATHLSRQPGRTESTAALAALSRFPLSSEARHHVRPAMEARSVTLPISEIGSQAGMLGHVAAQPDADGIIRRVTPWMSLDGHAVPLLGLATFLAAEWAEGRPVQPEFGEGLVRVGSGTVPLDADGQVRIRYRGPSGTHEVFSAAGVLQSYIRRQTGEAPPVVDPDVFRDAYVLFGFSAPGLMDLRPTPLSRVYPGVEVHATFLDNFLAGDFLREPACAAPIVWILLLGLVPGFSLVFARGAGTSAAAGFVAIAVPAITAFAAYPVGWVWPMAAPLLAAAIAVAGAWLYNYATEGRQKAFIKQAFRHYLSPAVIDRLVQDPSRLQLGGERREMTIFFSDLQGFSTIAERLDPGALTALLNTYLTDMTTVILDEGGTLDKYEGDAILAFWNAPIGQPDHAVRAVRAALRCSERLRERRADYREKFGADLHMRIGIHTGEVVVGNLGSGERFDYTVLGDAANLASRLEGANKVFGTGLMVSEATWSATGDSFSGRPLGRLRVVGRAAPVRVFEPLGAGGGSVPAPVAQFEDALRQFEAGRHADALAVFSALAKEDPAAAAYAERCKAILDGAEPTGDGVWNLSSK